MKVNSLSRKSVIEKVNKKDLHEKDNNHITMIQKITRAKKVISCMTCTNNSHYGHTRGLCGPRIQHAKGKLNKKECDHYKEGIWQKKKEMNKKAG
jgi:hypothetical protein